MHRLAIFAFLFVVILHSPEGRGIQLATEGGLAPLRERVVCAGFALGSQWTVAL